MKRSLVHHQDQGFMGAPNISSQIRWLETRLVSHQIATVPRRGKVANSCGPRRSPLPTRTRGAACPLPPSPTGCRCSWHGGAQASFRGPTAPPVGMWCPQNPLRKRVNLGPGQTLSDPPQKAGPHLRVSRGTPVPGLFPTWRGFCRPDPRA